MAKTSLGPTPGNCQRDESSRPHEIRGGRRPQSREQSPRGMIVFDDRGQVRGHATPLVQRAAEVEALVEERGDTMSANVDAKLSEVTKTRDPPVEEHVTFRPAGDSNDRAVSRLACDQRLMLVTFDRRCDRAV